MPKAHYRNVNELDDDGNIVDITRYFPMPKRLDRPESWITSIRKTIPEVPNVRSTDWFINSFDAGKVYIMIELLNSIGERARIAVNRTTHSI